MSWAHRAASELFGPNASATDRIMTVSAAAVGAALGVMFTFQGAPPLALSTALVFIVAFDLFGGLWSNAQSRAWRGVRRRWLWKVGFAALHPHAFAIAWAARDYSLLDAFLLWGWAVTGTTVVAALPAPRRLTAALFVCAVGAGALVAVNGSAALAWLPAVYLLKLVAAFAARSDDAT